MVPSWYTMDWPVVTIKSVVLEASSHGNQDLRTSSRRERSATAISKMSAEADKAASSPDMIWLRKKVDDALHGSTNKETESFRNRRNLVITFTAA
jgi:hypothetical protein